MKLDTDKGQAVSLNIEQERREFCNAVRADESIPYDIRKSLDDGIMAYMPAHFDGWLAAKRSMGSAEPVALVDVADSYEGPYKFDGLKLLPVGKHLLYTAPPAPVSDEPTITRELLTDLAEQCCEAAISKDANKMEVVLLFTSSELAEILEAQPAPAAPLSDAKDREFISEEDFSTLFHFNEQAQDSEADGYTASKEEMKRLAELGVVQSLGFGRYGVTSFGSWLIEKRFEQDTRLPLRTGAEHEKREHDAWKAYCEQMKSGDTAWVNLPNDVRHQWHERAAIAAAKGDME